MINFSLNTCWRLIPTQRIAKTLKIGGLAILVLEFSRNFPVILL